MKLNSKWLLCSNSGCLLTVFKLYFPFYVCHLVIKIYGAIRLGLKVPEFPNRGKWYGNVLPKSLEILRIVKFSKNEPAFN